MTEWYLLFASILPVEAGAAGLRVLLRDTAYREDYWPQEPLKAQEWRFPLSTEHPFRHISAGKCARASWLTFLGKNLVPRSDMLKGEGAPTHLPSLDPAFVQSAYGESEGGLLLRASRHPALFSTAPHIAVAGASPSNVGALPKIAKALLCIAPLRGPGPDRAYTTIAELEAGPYENVPMALVSAKN
jgi:hypothetical protein